MTEAEGARIDPARRRAWRRRVVAGAVVAVLGWVVAPIGLVATTYRPLRHLEGSVWTLVLAVAVLVGGLLLTGAPEPAAARPHRVGAWVVRVLLALAAGLAALVWALGSGGLLSAFLGWLGLPLTVLLLVLGFGYVGRLHRLADQARLANLADLMGLVTPLLWVAGQLVGGHPGPAMWGPGLVAYVIAGGCVGALAVVYARSG